ncbi:hydrogen peroxide-inducible genes activator [Sediminibacterium ginsengisoli]|uniref:LysR family transcriptional regulator, hydrogen peroxide-inducible genes activator n=1 Tax=Sediminibacterium ginsengisoli TaxID=413434 RepID=A0A1T4K6L8_9BACT|nr:hydrogen peroxide-inducible genes activator [Sediminibacterium ginsengisoli]SJZ38062.1 LysR family transcriptional regulator, hydrogen peroxide-inducible genes activator [Sediminibacterium ginsengisoli]
MTFTQLEYIIAVDTWRHFALAAENCYVSQPTLSMQIQKAEKRLGVKIFDRSKQPVIPTEIGAELIEQARKIIAEKNRMDELVKEKKGIVSGEIRIGIIPTLAPYLLPLFVPQFAKKYPLVKLVVNEMMTDVMISRLREGRIDMGILVTPLHEPGIREHVLFYEELMAYVSRKNAAYKKTYVLPQDIDPDKLWLLEEGHCFRSQIVHLCELKKASQASSHFEYEAGSIETLRRMVELNDGITIIPELATIDMTGKQLGHIRYFKKPAPMREVSIAVHRDFVKKKLVEIIRQEIMAAIPEKIRQNKQKNVVPVL